MDSETPIIRYIAGAVGVVLICFCVGYFLLGPRPGTAAPAVAQASPAPEPSAVVVRGPAPKLTVLETTASDSQHMDAERHDATHEATPAPTPSPQATAIPERKPKQDGDEPIKIPAPKPDALPGDDEEVKPADPPVDAAKPAESGADTVYRVRVKDSFGSHDDAEQLASELKGRGFSATVMPAGKGKFEVQIGAYKDKKRAEDKQKELEKNSYKTRITDKEVDLDKTDKPDAAPAGDNKSSEKEADPSKEKAGGAR
ncbi:MAG: SPOR domain-containing protein [Armatimonas sp.]